MTRKNNTWAWGVKDPRGQIVVPHLQGAPAGMSLPRSLTPFSTQSFVHTHCTVSSIQGVRKTAVNRMAKAS